MKAFCSKSHPVLYPFGDRISDIEIGNQPLNEIQREILLQCGFEVVDEAPVGEGFLWVQSNVWFTAELLQKMKSSLPLESSRLRCLDEVWNRYMTSIVSEKQGYVGLAWIVGSLPDDLSSLPDWILDWELREQEALEMHPSMQHAVHPMKGGACMALDIWHWYDVLRVNQLALLYRAESIRSKWEKGSIWKRLLLVMGFLFKVHSINPQKIARRIGSQGRNCKIHPTAVIEACEIGDNVEIGPFAVLRASILGNGCKIEEHATVNLSVIGRKARVARYAMINLSVLMEEAFVSRGGGFQMSLFGRQSFVAVDAVMLDLSFGKSIHVQHRAQISSSTNPEAQSSENMGSENMGSEIIWIDSQQFFMGVCVGHRAAIGNAVRLNYGVTVPNDALLVANADHLIKDASLAPPSHPSRAKDKKAVPI